MSILKLANAGDEATLDITGCEVVEGQYGEQVQFDAGEDRLYLPRSSADRQLERLGLMSDEMVEYGMLVGERLTFSRTASTKPGAKPFWNIAKAGNGKPPVAKTVVTSSKPVSLANKPDSELPELLRDAESQDAKALAEKIGVDLGPIQRNLAVYQSIAEWAAKTLPPIFNAGKDAVGMTPESLAACVNTLYINAAGKK